MLGQILVFPAIFSHRHWWTLQLGDYQALVDFTHHHNNDDDLDLYDDTNDEDLDLVSHNNDEDLDLDDDTNNEDLDDDSNDDDLYLDGDKTDKIDLDGDKNDEDLDFCWILWRQQLPIRWYYRHWAWITVMNDLVELQKF